MLVKIATRIRFGKPPRLKILSDIRRCPRCDECIYDVYVLHEISPQEEPHEQVAQSVFEEVASYGENPPFAVDSACSQLVAVLEPS
jgi:hypothetical protein